MKKLITIITTILLVVGSGIGLYLKSNADSGQKIILEVQFLEEGTNRVLAEPTNLEGDQGVLASIQVPVQLRDEYTITAQGFDQASTDLINQGQFYGTKLIYQIRFKKVPKEAPTPQVGPYTLNITEFDESGRNYQVNYPDAQDVNGKPIKQGPSQSTDFATTFGYFTIDEDGALVWCYDPALPVRNGAKYERTIINENTDAALLQNFGIGYAGHEKSYLLASAQQRMLWALQGNKFPKDPYVIERDKDSDGNYSNSKLRQLTDDEKTKIKQFEDDIANLTALYKSGKTVDWSLVSGDALGIKDNTIGVKQDSASRKITLSSTSEDGKKIINAYKNGTINPAKDINVEINGDNVVITLPADIKPGTYDIADFSMMRKEYIGDTYSYTSNYGGQPLQVNRIKDPKKQTLKLEVIPSEPTQPTKPAQPTKPQVEPIKPVEPTKIVEPIEPIKPVEPNKPDELVKPIKPEEPKKPIPPMDPIIELEPIKPTRPIEPIKPVEPVKPENNLTEPTPPAKPGLEKPIKPREPGEPTKPVEPNKPVINNPSGSTKPTEPTKPTPQNLTQPVKPNEPNKPTIGSIDKPVEPTKPNLTKPTPPARPNVGDPNDPSKPTLEKPVEPTRPNINEPAEPTKPNMEKPTKPGEPAEPTKPVEPNKPVEPTKPTKPGEPVEPTRPHLDGPTEPTKPVEPTAPNKPSLEKPTKPAEPKKPENKKLPESGDIASFGLLGLLAMVGAFRLRLSK